MAEPEAKPTSDKADCYASGERAAMQWSQDLRARLLSPLLALLRRCRVTPDHLTLASLLVGLAFCPLWFASRPLALAALALHVALDGLDGPLARSLGTASRRGSFTDTTADQTVVVASTIALISAGDLHVAAGCLYAVVYTVVVYFAMVRNALRVPYSWLVRPRFLVYAWLVVETWLWPGTLDWIVWLCNAVLAAKLLSGFVQIRRSL